MTNVYDGFGRLMSSSINMSAVTRTLAYQYDVAGNRIRITHPDSQYFATNYDAPGRLTALTENGVSRLTAGYNPAGLVANLSRGGTASTFGYDDVNRLTSLIHDLSGTGADVTWTQGFNPASQITSRTRSNDAYAWTGAVNVNRTYTRNGLNQYTAAGTATFAYDPNGNLTSDGSNGFVYDVENRLVAASGGHVASLVYDPLGRLFEVAGGGATTRFLYDGDALVAEYNTSGALLRRYVHGSNAAADDPLLWYEGAIVSDATRHYLFADHQGSIVAMTDSVGALIAEDTYDEYGIPGAGNQAQERFQYTGQAWLAELGMYYYKARIYSPTLGRFMQTDPVGYADQFNLYEYVGDDPVNRSDPSGMCFENCPVGSGDAHADRLTRYAETGRGADGHSFLMDHTGLVAAARNIITQVPGAVHDFHRNYSNMVHANTIGADKYFHCSANCQASARGSGGEFVSRRISNGREIIDQWVKGDPHSASMADQRANIAGRQGGEAARNSSPGGRWLSRQQRENMCRAVCAPFRPRGLDNRY